MNQDIHSEEMYEIFQGDLRKLDELIGQLELWSDEYTINHKKEELRLPQYIELHNNLEEQKELMADFLSERVAEEGKSDRIVGYQELIQQKLEAYEETENVIYEWVRAIKDIQVLITRSEVLQNNKEYIENILNGQA